MNEVSVNPLSDTNPKADQAQVAILRKLSPSRRLELTLQLTNLVYHNARRAIRQAHPQYTEDEVKLFFIELNYGTDLAKRVKERMKVGARASTNKNNEH